ncbi:MAG TPA: DedA family protein [Mycobacteriales bacterium]|nr:DedA family protein [Mycobacteriales bacterium]
MEHWIEHLFSVVPGWLAVLLVFLCPFLEASVFLGVVFPGEIAVFLGGVIASGGIDGAPHVPLAVVLVAAIAGAVLGDQIGFFVGERWGYQLLRKIPHRLLPDEHLQKSRDAIKRMGAKAVIVGRWTAALRALVPGLAGMSGMPYVRFAVANFVGGALWATTVVLLGDQAGRSWKHVYHLLSRYSLYAFGVIVAGLVAWLLWRRRQRRLHPPEPEPEVDVEEILAELARDRAAAEAAEQAEEQAERAAVAETRDRGRRSQS